MTAVFNIGPLHLLLLEEETGSLEAHIKPNEKVPLTKRDEACHTHNLVRGEVVG
jgi:hypothetical protein